MPADAERLGHTNTRTTKLHYLGKHVPPMTVLPFRFEHPDDPQPEDAATVH